MVNGDLVAVPVRFAGKNRNSSMDMAGVDPLTVRSGKIAEVRLFSEHDESEDTFYGHA